MPKKQDYERPVEPRVQCSFAMCQTGATMRLRTKTGWANVCNRHAEELNLRETHDWLRETGLTRQPGETQREWIDRMREYVKAARTTKARPHISSALPELPVPSLPTEPAHTEFAPWDEAPAPEQDIDALT